MLFVGDYCCFIFQEWNARNLRKHDFQLEQIQNMFLESYRKCLQHGCRVDAFKTHLIPTYVRLALCVRGRKK